MISWTLLYASYQCKMSLSKALKRKIDSECRTYKEEWKQRYAFILPAFINAKPTCLICNEAVAVCKEYNIRRHHETKHGQFKNVYPPGTEVRTHKIKALEAGYAHSTKILVRSLTEQQRVTSASLKAAWVYAHSRANTVPTCASWITARMFHLLFCHFSRTIIYTSINVSKLMGLL